MAVVRTFDPKIDLAGAYLGGQNIQLGRERIAQQAAEAGARINLGYAQLQQEAVANEMQLAAKKDILSREALQKAQEAEIEKSYKETQFGLARRRLEDDEMVTKMRLREAATDFENQQKWMTEFPSMVQSGVASGKTPQQAEADAARSLMLQRGGTGAASALSTGREPSQLPATRFEFQKLESAKDDLLRKYPGSMALAIPPAVQAKLDEISAKQQKLSGVSALPQMGTSAAPRVRRWNRKTGKFE